MNVVVAKYRRSRPVPVVRPVSTDDPIMNFRVELETFKGPLDLLLYLVRKHEVDVVEMPIALITDQFLAHLEVLEKLDINGIGEFIDMASTLVELKSRLVLPHADEIEEPIEAEREDLVRRLLEYKEFRDAAAMLEDRSRGWQEHFARTANDRAAGPRDPGDEPIHEVELWDLVSAFARILRENQPTPQTNIVYDDTPIHVHMRRIAARLNEQGGLALGDLFEGGMHKSKLVGMFLAVLELARHHSVRTEQHALFGEIFVYPGPNSGEAIDAATIDDYDHQAGSATSATATAAAPVAPTNVRADAPHATTEPAKPKRSRAAKKPK